MDVKATLEVTAPTTAPTGGWTRFDLVACTAPTVCNAAVACTRSGATTACDLTGLAANTAYTVKVAAVGGTGGTVRSLNATVALTTSTSDTCVAAALRHGLGWTATAAQRARLNAAGA